MNDNNEEKETNDIKADNNFVKENENTSSKIDDTTRNDFSTTDEQKKESSEKEVLGSFENEIPEPSENEISDSSGKEIPESSEKEIPKSSEKEISESSESSEKGTLKSSEKETPESSSEETHIDSEETVVSSMAVQDTVVTSIQEKQEELDDTQTMPIIEETVIASEATVKMSTKGVIEEPEDVLKSVEEKSNDLENITEESGELPMLLAKEAIVMLKENGTIENRNIHFLNLDETEFNTPIVFKNCLLEGIVARGAIFNKNFEIIDCQIKERLELSALKKEAKIESTLFHEDLIVKNTIFDRSILMRNTHVSGDVTFQNCTFHAVVRFDFAKIKGNVAIQGNEILTKLSAFRCKCDGNFKIQDHTIPGERNESLDFNSSNIATLSLVKCNIKNALKMRRAHIGNEETSKAFYVHGCTFENIEMMESIFYGTTYWNEVSIKGTFNAQLKREEKTNKPGKAVLFKKDFHFENIQFYGKTNFYGARFKMYAKFTKSTFHKESNFNQCEFNQVSSFWMSEFLGKTNFKKVTFGGRTNFGKVSFGDRGSFNDSTFKEEANFYLAKAEKDLFFSNCYFSDNLVLRSVVLEDGLNLSKIRIEKDLKISQSTVKGRFILTGSHVKGRFLAPALSIGTWGSLSECFFDDYVDLGGLKVGRRLTDEDKAKLDKLKKEDRKDRKADEIVPGSFYMDTSTFHKEINLFATKIAGDFSLNHSNIYNETDLNSLTVGNDFSIFKAYFRGVVFCENAKIGNVDTERSRFKDEVSWNGLKCKSASFRFTSFDGGFTMRYAYVKDELRMYNADVDGKADLFRCEFGRIYFNHMIVDHFLIDRHSIGDQLTSEKEGKFGNAATEYGILKQSFQQRNDYESMDWAYYRFCRSKRKMKQIGWRHPITSIKYFLNWLLLDKGFGYGTNPMNIAGVAFSLIVIFAGIFYCVPGGILGSNGPLASISFADAFYTSITTFASMDYGDGGPFFDHWLKHLFSLEGILGIFLTTLFVATISRKIIRT